MLWTKEHESVLKIYYNNADKNYLIKHLNRSWQAIKHKAMVMNLSRPKTKPFNYFRSWSNNMSYILGFIAADGWVDEYRVGIKLSSKDISHLYRIRDIIAPNTKITTRANNAFGGIFKSSEFIISSKEASQSIQSLGIIPRKSLTMVWPNIPKKYLSHFIRGYFDGDGSIYRNNRFAQIEIVGSMEFLKSLSELLYTHGLSKNRQKINKTQSKIYRLRYGHRDGKKILKWIYQGADLKLERKYTRCIELYQEL